jgi:hypothetical protein
MTWTKIKQILEQKRPQAVKRKISLAMKGQSNFEGQTHSKSTKHKMSASRGHNDQGKVGGSHWFKPTAYTTAKPDKRKRGAVKPQGYKKGRSI